VESSKRALFKKVLFKRVGRFNRVRQHNRVLCKKVLSRAVPLKKGLCRRDRNKKEARFKAPCFLGNAVASSAASRWFFAV
jgi:hypothetical protein